MQVLNVPVGPLAVMTDASPQTSGAIRAADINVPAGAQAQGAQSPDADGAGAGAGEQQDVGAGLGGRHGSIVERQDGADGRMRGTAGRPARSRRVHGGHPIPYLIFEQ